MSESITGKLDTPFLGGPPPIPIHIQGLYLLLGISLLIALVCAWRWIRHRQRSDIRARCRIVLSAATAALLYGSIICLLLDLMMCSDSLAGAGQAASGMRMLAYAETVEHFRVGFAGFTLTGLLALIMGFFEPRVPAPAEAPGART